MPTAACSKVSRNSFSRSIAYLKTPSAFVASFLGAEELLDDFRELAEQRHLDVAELAHLRVHGAQRADRLAVAGEQRDPEIGAAYGAALDTSGLFAKRGSAVASRTMNGRALEDGLGAERGRARGFAQRRGRSAI